MQDIKTIRRVIVKALENTMMMIMILCGEFGGKRGGTVNILVGNDVWMDICMTSATTEKRDGCRINRGEGWKWWWWDSL